MTRHRGGGGTRVIAGRLHKAMEAAFAALGQRLVTEKL
jgi:hypothetical protein